MNFRKRNSFIVYFQASLFSSIIRQIASVLRHFPTNFTELCRLYQRKFVLDVIIGGLFGPNDLQSHPFKEI